MTRALTCVLITTAVGALTGCTDHLGFAVATTADFDTSVTDDALARVTSIAFDATGNEPFRYVATLDHSAKRTERLLYYPPTDSRTLEITLTAEDSTGASVASGLSAELELEPMKTTYTTITLSADAELPDSAVPDECDGPCGPAIDMATLHSVPAAAAAVGFDTLTFDSTTLGTTAGTWQLFNFPPGQQPSDAAQQNANGTIELTGNGTGNATIATASLNPSLPERWQGLAFGGGGYFEVTLSFPGTPDGTKTSPFFFAFDVEHASGFESEDQAGASWINIYALETDRMSDTMWDESFKNYYNQSNEVSGFPFKLPTNVGASNPEEFPDGGNFNQSHAYAFLWVPATSSQLGSLTYYVDGAQVGEVAQWDKYSASQGFPPEGNDICNVLDTLHLVLILGDSSPTYPAIITSAHVWQASAANNVTY